MKSRIIVADCLIALRAAPGASVDAIVTDPPYGLGFMGKAWDDLPPGVEWARECLRILKPGGYLLAFGGTRTHHRLACAIEDAGFEIRDTLCWLYGSGFPKSHDVSKAIDKAAGAKRETVGEIPARMPQAQAAGWGNPGTDTFRDGRKGTVQMAITAPATPEAERWAGWGTALKPAFEPIVLARKPFKGTVAANVLAYGTGALNVDGCRVGTTTETHASKPRAERNGFIKGFVEGTATVQHEHGRWPANVLLDPEAAALLDAQTGTSTSRVGKPRGAAPGAGWGMTATGAEYADTGGASRFFYCAKASSKERNAGLDGFAAVSAGVGDQRPSGDFSERLHRGEREHVMRKNHHPTVKPVSLMRWLVRLVTPPGGLVLDPFAGSGTTGIACGLEAMRFVGIEQDPDYAEIARARIAWWARRDAGETQAVLTSLLRQDAHDEQLELTT